ncbi:c-type cytochrome [Legionella lansingensis]|nr:c-type cytochrome [Legionella lansingensis]
MILILGWLMASFCYSASHHPQDFLKQIQGTPNEGEQIVQHFCANCHALKPLIDVGAPRIGEKEDWQVRLQKGIGDILQHTLEGINAMPPRGGCFECTDQQLVLAIVAMLPEEFRASFLLALKDHKKYN